MSKSLDLVGQKFGMLTVLSKASPRRTSGGYSQTQWNVQCDCGSPIKIIRTQSLRIGDITSCGCNQSKAQAPGVSLKNFILSMYKASATRRKLEWALKDEQFDVLVKQNCYYCGIEPFNVLTKRGQVGSFTYNGIDRVDNLKGYTVGNVVSCCKICNYAKGRSTPEEFDSWLNRIRNFKAKSAGV